MDSGQDGEQRRPISWPQLLETFQGSARLGTQAGPALPWAWTLRKFGGQASDRGPKRQLQKTTTTNCFGQARLKRSSPHSPRNAPCSRGRRGSPTSGPSPEAFSTSWPSHSSFRQPRWEGPAAVPLALLWADTEPHLAQVASAAQRARAGAQNHHCLQPTGGGGSIQSKT